MIIPWQRYTISVQRGIRRDSSFLSPCFILLVFCLSLYPALVPSILAAEGKSPQENRKTIIELQPFRQTSTTGTTMAGGSLQHDRLINLSPRVNAWHVLQRDIPFGPPETYHLENVYSRDQQVSLQGDAPGGIAIDQGEKRIFCALWNRDASTSLKEARQTGIAYTPLCSARLYLRNSVRGHETSLEKVTEFLRENIPGGEEIIISVRNLFFNYFYEKKAEEKPELKAEKIMPLAGQQGPEPARLSEKAAGLLVRPVDLGIETADKATAGFLPGTWQEAKNNPGIFVSVMAPQWIAPEIRGTYKKIIHNLDPVEAEGLVYLIAFDLKKFDLAYSLGTLHPQVGWSGHILASMKNNSLPGPDGIGNSAPLVRTGLINPRDAAKTVATFTGGFKRYHGAFKYGPLARKNQGSHYGFLEKGVLFSKLQPGLATLISFNDGTVAMKTWSEEDNALLPEIVSARQNGVPLIASYDPVAGLSLPGPLVGEWGPGNWSGSAASELRTMRSGVGLQEVKGKQFLIYAFFWSATPSAMARIFQAYQVRYAMLLDMNALVHTYLAIYNRQGENIVVQHLIKGMGEADTAVKGQVVPRFLAAADNRDFFYLTRKDTP